MLKKLLKVLKFRALHCSGTRTEDTVAFVLALSLSCNTKKRHVLLQKGIVFRVQSKDKFDYCWKESKKQ